MQRKPVKPKITKGLEVRVWKCGHVCVAKYAMPYPILSEDLIYNSCCRCGAPKGHATRWGGWNKCRNSRG